MRRRRARRRARHSNAGGRGSPARGVSARDGLGAVVWAIALAVCAVGVECPRGFAVAIFLGRVLADRRSRDGRARNEDCLGGLAPPTRTSRSVIQKWIKTVMRKKPVVVAVLAVDGLK